MENPPGWIRQLEKRFDDLREDNRNEHQEIKTALKDVQFIEANCQTNHLPHIDKKLSDLTSEQKAIKRFMLITMCISIGIAIQNWDKVIELIKLVKELFL